MKTAIITLIIAMMAIPYSSKVNNEDKTVSLSDVSSLLTKFEGDEKYDFVKEEITYKEIEEEKYDEVYKESAIIYATVKQVRETVDGINDGKIDANSEFAIICIGFAVKDLPDMDNRINTLLEKTKTMKPKDDFKGKNLRKVGKAGDGLNTSKKQLNESAALLPKLLTDLAEVSKKVIK